MTFLHVLAISSVHHDLLTPDAVVLLQEVKFVNQLLLKERGISWVDDLHLAHHLTHDNLEVLVIDLHTLQTIHVLYFVDNIFLHGGGTLDGKDVVWRDDTIRKRCASTDSIMLLHKDLLGERYLVTLLVACLGSDDNLAVTTFHLTHGDLTINLRDNGGVAGVASLEQLGDTWQTTRDVTSTTHGTWYLDDGLSCLNHCTVFDNDVSSHREVICANNHAVFIQHITSRNLGVVFGVGDDFLGHTRCLVGLSLKGCTLDDIVEFQLTSIFRHDDSIEWIPLGDEIAPLHLFTLLEIERTTVWHVERREDDARVRIDKTNLGKVADHHLAYTFLLTHFLYEWYGVKFVKFQS